jgi:hypothetical protein
MSEKKPTLWDLQDRVLEFEQQINADQSDLSIILGDIAQKIDNIKQIIDVFNSEKERFKKYKDEMATREKSLGKAIERLESYVVACLEKHDTNFEMGNIWVAKIRENKRIETFDDPTAKDMLKLSQNGIFCVKTSFVWDKVAIKEALASDDKKEVMEQYAKLATSKSINFSTVNAAGKAKK